VGQVRLPLQIGRAALNQSARFSVCVWLGPALLLTSGVLAQGLGWILAIPLALAAFVALAFALEARGLAKRDRPTDLLLSAEGFTIEGGPIDGTRCTWSEVEAARCAITSQSPRLAVRWLLLSWLTLRLSASVNARVRVPVHQLALKRRRGEPLVLAQGEGEELESLEQLRDAIRGAATVDEGESPEAPPHILRCASCGAPQVPLDAATTTCAHCGVVVPVPVDLQERVRASSVLEKTSVGRAELVKQLIDQPSARHAENVIGWCRRVMVWSQPAALALIIALLVHQAGRAAGIPEGVSVARDAPSDDVVALYDLVLVALVVGVTLTIAWGLGHAYVANRQALRLLADNFGAVPPVADGEPSTCRDCGAPLGASDRVLVRCVYCQAENVLGVDPRPAALRRKRERVDLARGLARRARARVTLAIAIPVSVAAALFVGREVHRAWHIPAAAGGLPTACVGSCGSITNRDVSPRSFTIARGGRPVEVTLPPRGQVTWSCFSGCTLDVGGTQFATEWGVRVDGRIERGTFVR
jgi:hypothetical protein